MQDEILTAVIASSILLAFSQMPDPTFRSR
jgi:hypothetical protein